jgi:uncharacterized protein (TIGR02453 family)
MLKISTLQFLRNLKKNNQRSWLESHRLEYETARQDFVGFIQKTIDVFSEKETSLQHLNANDCLFRLNRDVRFSKDKSPYKTNFGAYINVEGKKAVTAGYYFHLDPDGNSFVGGGMWMPAPAQLIKVRQEIDYNLAEFKKIITAKKFENLYKGLSSGEDDVLMRVPKGYLPDNPAAEYLKYKSFTATAPLSDDELVSKKLLDQIVKAYETLRPLVTFLNEAIAV